MAINKVLNDNKIWIEYAAKLWSQNVSADLILDSVADKYEIIISTGRFKEIRKKLPIIFPPKSKEQVRTTMQKSWRFKNCI